MQKAQLVCTGCGVLIQTADEKAAGYVPEQVLNRDRPICQRCYRIKHYRDIMEVSLDANDYRKILDNIACTEAIVVQVVDLFDLEGSWIPGIHRLVGQNEIFLAANKVDLLPHGTNWQRVGAWLIRQAYQQELHVQDVVMFSAKTGEGLKEFVQRLEKWRDGRNVYIVGTTNVGKSTLVNQLVRRLTASFKRKPFSYETAGVELLADWEVTTSPYPGTTLDTVRIPLPGGQALIDTPGLVNERQLTYYLMPEDLKVVVPDRTLKPRVYQLNPQQTLFFGGLARFDFLQGAPQSFVCYVSNALPVHRTKRERAGKLYEEHLGGLLVPPWEAGMDKFPRWVRRTFSINGNQDVVIAGLGWVACKGGASQVEVYAPEKVDVVMRDSML